MRGIDCTPEQLASAKQFIESRQRGARRQLGDTDMVTLPVADLVCIVAWYGALRFQSGRDGVGGSLEAPGEFVVSK
jgi:hypothetical protein